MSKVIDNELMCHSKDCDNVAVIYMVWTEPIYVCSACASGWLRAGNAMGFHVPHHTMRKITDHERNSEILHTPIEDES